MPRVGRRLGSRPATGIWSVRASYGLFYDQFQNGAGHGLAGGDQRDAVGAVQSSSAAPGSTSRTRIWAARLPAPEHVRPAVDRLRARRRRQAAVRAELERRASSARCSSRYLVEVRYVGAAGKTPAAQRRGEPRRLRSWRDGAERRPPAHLRQLPRRRQRLRFLDHRDAAQHHELVVSAPARRACRGASADGSASTCRTGIRDVRLSLGDEPVRRRGQAAGRRERSGAESVRPRRRVRAVALRRAPSLRGQRELEADDRRTARRRRCAPSSAAGS